MYNAKEIKRLKEVNIKYRKNIPMSQMVVDEYIDRIASAETILELFQPDSNPEYFYKKAQQHLRKYRG